MDPAQLPAPVWIFDNSAESAGWVASGRRLARTASMSSLWLSSVNSVPIARSTVSSLRWSWNSSTHGATSQTPRRRPSGGPEPDLALASSRVLAWHRVIRGGGLGETQVAQAAGDLGGLTALAAGVEYLDLRVGELGGRDLGHVGRGHLLAELGVGWGRWGCRRGVARRRLGHIGGALRATIQTTWSLTECDETSGSPDVIAPTEWPTVFVEGRAFCDLMTTRAL